MALVISNTAFSPAHAESVPAGHRDAAAAVLAIGIASHDMERLFEALRRFSSVVQRRIALTARSTGSSTMPLHRPPRSGRSPERRSASDRDRRIGRCPGWST
jgi:hypothetical protein